MTKLRLLKYLKIIQMTNQLFLIKINILLKNDKTDTAYNPATVYKKHS